MVEPDRRQFLRAAGVTTIGGLAGCSGSSNNDGSTPTASGGSSGSGGGSTATKTKSQSLTAKLALSHYPTIPGTIPWQVAKDQGFFEKHGITKAEITSFGGGGTTVRGVVTGGLDIGSTALLAMVKAFNAGAPIYLAGLCQVSPDIDFEVPPDSSIESIQDIKGKTVAISNPGSSSETCLILSVSRAEGISLDDVNIMYAGGLGESITAVKEGKADVTWNIVPKSTAMLSKGTMRRIWHTRDFAPKFAEIPVGIGQQVLDNELPLAKGLMRTMIDGIEYTQKNSKEAAKIWAEQTDMPEDFAVKAMADFKPEQSLGVKLDEENLKGTGKAFVKQGELKNEPPWQKLIRQEALPEKYRVDWVK